MITLNVNTVIGDTQPSLAFKVFLKSVTPVIGATNPLKTTLMIVIVQPLTFNDEKVHVTSVTLAKDAVTPLSAMHLLAFKAKNTYLMIVALFKNATILLSVKIGGTHPFAYKGVNIHLVTILLSAKIVIGLTKSLAANKKNLLLKKVTLIKVARILLSAKVAIGAM